MDDARYASDPVPITEFTFDVKEIRYVRVDMLSYYGSGGGLQYFSVVEIKCKGCNDCEVTAGFICKI